MLIVTLQKYEKNLRTSKKNHKKTFDSDALWTKNPHLTFAQTKILL